MYSRWVVFGTKFSFFVFVSSVLVSGSDKHVGQYVPGSLFYAEIFLVLMLARMFSSSLADNLVMRCPPDLLAIKIIIIIIIILTFILEDTQ